MKTTETISSGRRVLSSALLVVAGIAASMFSATPALAGYHSPMHIGVRCQDNFQNGWNPTIDTYSMCTDFINTIGSTDWIDFYFNLHGARVDFVSGNSAETCNACGGVDSVDFFLMNTHGGVNPTDTFYAMWDQNSSAFVSQMRLGDSGKQVKIFATYACDNFKTSDGNFWKRWSGAYRGGLKIGLGAHDLVYDGNAQKGIEFASRIQDSQPVGLSWLEAVWYADNNNHPSVANTGTNSTDCWNRQGADLATVESMSQLRDGKIGFYCYSGWNGD